MLETLQELIKRMWEFWDEYGKNRERIGELIQRVGMANFLEASGSIRRRRWSPRRATTLTSTSRHEEGGANT